MITVSKKLTKPHTWTRRPVDDAWKARVKAELERRGMSYEALAERIGVSRAGIYKLLGTPQRTSSYVDPIDDVLEVGRAFVPVRGDDHARRRFDELLERMTPDNAKLILQMMEKLAGNKPA